MLVPEDDPGAELPTIFKASFDASILNVFFWSPPSLVRYNELEPGAARFGTFPMSISPLLRVTTSDSPFPAWAVLNTIEVPAVLPVVQRNLRRLIRLAVVNLQFLEHIFGMTARTRMTNILW